MSLGIKMTRLVKLTSECLTKGYFIPTWTNSWETNWERRRNTDHIHNQRHQNFTWKIQITKNHIAARKFTILPERLSEKKREHHSRSVFTRHTHTSVYNPNDDASPFTKKTRVKNYEITEMPLTCSPSFTGYKTFRLDRFSTMHLRRFTLHCRFGVLLCLDASGCSVWVMPSCYSKAKFRPCPQPETLNSPNLFPMSASLSLLDLQDKLLKVILFRRLCPWSQGGGLFALFQPPRQPGCTDKSA